jgi:predicted secreted protein
MEKLSIRNVVLLCTGLLAAAAAGAEVLRYNQVTLQAQQSEAVANDTMHVTLRTFDEGPDPARLAAGINRDMEWALALAREDKDLDVRTGNYQTYPVRHKNEHKGWRAQQDLELEGRDTEAISALVGRLQEKLQVSSIRFSVSDDRRIAVENRLIAAALDAYRERARIIGDNLGANGYRLVDIHVNSAGQRPPPIPYQARMATVASEAAPIAVEAGESRITVTVNGSIELLLP